MTIGADQRGLFVDLPLASREKVIFLTFLHDASRGLPAAVSGDVGQDWRASRAGDAVTGLPVPGTKVGPIARGKVLEEELILEGDLLRHAAVDFLERGLLAGEDADSKRAESLAVIRIGRQQVAQGPPPGIVLPRVARRFTRPVNDLAERSRLDRMNVAGDKAGAVDAGVILNPVLPHLGHPLGVPNGAGRAKRLIAVSVNGLVLRRSAIGNRIDDSFGEELSTL